MLSPISLESSSLSLSKQKTNEVQLRTIPSTEDKTRLTETEIGQQLNNAASVKSDRVSPIQSPAEVNKPSETAPVAPERPRFDTFERTEPMPSAGVYSVKAGEDGKREISFQMPEDVVNTPVSSAKDMTSSVQSAPEPSVQSATEPSVQSASESSQGVQLPSESPVLPADNEVASASENAASEASEAIFSVKKENLAVSNQAIQAELDAVNQDKPAEQITTPASEAQTEQSSSQADDTKYSAMSKDSSYEQNRVDLLNDELSKALEQMQTENREQDNSQRKTYVEAVLS